MNHLPKKNPIIFSINIFVVLVSIIGFLYLSNELSPALAGHVNTGGQEGWYCSDEHTVWHDIEIPTGASNPDSYHEPFEDCGGDEVCRGQVFAPGESSYSQDAACEKTSSREPQGEGTNMYANPPTVEFNHEIVFGITADRIACYDRVTVDNLRVRLRMQNCRITAQDCGCNQKHICHEVDEHNDPTNPGRVTGHHTDCSEIRDCGPDDWHAPSAEDPVDHTPLGVNPYDDKQCYKDITCTAIGLNSLNAPLRTEDGFCDSNVDYRIDAQNDIPDPVPAESCNPTSDNPPRIPREGDGQHIITTTLNDDKQTASDTAFLTLDPSVLASINRICSIRNEDIQLPPTTIDQNFLQEIASNIGCSLGLNRAFPTFFRCIKPINTSQAQTRCGQQIAEDIANSEFERSLPRGSKRADCAIQDLELPPLPDGRRIMTDGSATVSAMQRDLGNKPGQGVYSEYLPEFMEEDCPYDPLQNLNLEGAVFNDDRVPDINCKADMFYQSEFEVRVNTDF